MAQRYFDNELTVYSIKFQNNIHVVLEKQPHTDFGNGKNGKTKNIKYPQVLETETYIGPYCGTAKRGRVQLLLYKIVNENLNSKLKITFFVFIVK